MHLIVLCHGMWGNIHHFDYIVEELTKKGAISHDSGALPALRADSTVVYRTSSNQGYFTYDGVDVCGLRVADEITNEIKLLGAAGFKVSEISLMGYSMGGIIMRYAAGILETQHVFDDIKPRVFTTMFSPHLGVRVLNPGYGPAMFNFIGSWSMARTSRQVFLQDRHHNWGVPLFLHLTSNDTPYVAALKRFDTRCLYANIANDRRCEFYTAAAECSDPYRNKQKLLKGPFVPGYAPTLLTPAKPEFVDEEPIIEPASMLNNVVSSIALLFKITIALPIWFGCFLTNAAYQALVSSIRTSPIVKSGRLLRVEEEASSQIDSLLELEANRIVENVYNVLGEPKLAISPEVSLIQKQFNELGWNKFYVHITADSNAHAAAIYRLDRPSYYEGKLVIQHWISQVLAF